MAGSLRVARASTGGPDPIADVVARVVAAEVARVGARGALLAGFGCEARALLADWLRPLVAVTVVDDGGVTEVARALHRAGAEPSVRDVTALRAWAETEAAARGLVPVGMTDKTTLLLGSDPLPARVLALGDLWASELADLGCAVAPPPVLRGRTAEEVRRVDAALSEYLEGGAAPDTAFGALGPLGEDVRRALDAGISRRRGLLVPKLTGWTVGVDLDR